MFINHPRSNFENKDYVLKAVSEKFTIYEIISEKLKDDEDVLRAACFQSGIPMKYASLRLRSNKELAIYCLQPDAFAYRHLSEQLRQDKEVTILAVKKNGLMLRYASKELIGDKEVALHAVHNFGDSLACVSEELKNDKEVVLTAIRQNPGSLRFASAAIHKMVFKQDALDVLAKMVNSQKLAQSLDMELIANKPYKNKKI